MYDKSYIIKLTQEEHAYLKRKGKINHLFLEALAQIDPEFASIYTPRKIGRPSLRREEILARIQNDPALLEAVKALFGGTG